MKIGTENSIKISLLEVTPPNSPSPGDLKLKVTVKCKLSRNLDEFIGNNSEIWVEKEKFEVFLKDLAELESNRQRSAFVEAMSPGEFELKFFPTNHSGAIAVSGKIGVYTYYDSYVNSGAVETVLKFEFPIDSSSLARILKDFQKLKYA